MSSPAAQATPSPAPSPARHPLERAIVWGVIALGVVVIAIEGRARLAYAQSLSRIQAALDAAEQQELSSFHVDQLPEMIAGSPSVSDESHRFHQMRHYQWNGLFKQYGLHVRYGMHTKLVTGVLSDNPPPDPQAVMALPSGDSPVDSAHAEYVSRGPGGPGSGFGGGAGGGGGMGGGPRRNPMESDADKDGKLSRDEVQGRLAEAFDEIDTNHDSFLDEPELAARFARRGGGGPGGPMGPPPGAGGEGRQRPPLDEPAGEAPAVPEGASPPATESTPATDAPALETPADNPATNSPESPATAESPATEAPVDSPVVPEAGGPAADQP